jgi:hypothetical protein
MPYCPPPIRASPEILMSGLENGSGFISGFLHAASAC